MDGPHGLPISLSEIHTQAQAREVQSETELEKKATGILHEKEGNSFKYDTRRAWLV